MAPDFTIPFFCEHTHHRVWDMKMHVLWMSSGLWWIFKACVTFWVQSLNRWASPKIHRCTCGIFLSEFASTLVFNYLIYWAFEVGSAFCLCWFVSCVHLHGVVKAHIHVLPLSFAFTGNSKRLQDHDCLGQGHLQECPLRSSGWQWEKVQNLSVSPTCDSSDPDVCLRSECLFLGW